MINPMLTDPVPDESVVWLKLSQEDAYVVCFEGPLDGGLNLAGAWKMSGHQEGFNDWKADLNLKSDGTLEWTETEGANVGAERQGTWQFDGTMLSLKWISPGGGQTSWTSGRSRKFRRVRHLHRGEGSGRNLVCDEVGGGF